MIIRKGGQRKITEELLMVLMSLDLEMELATYPFKIMFILVAKRKAN